MDFVDPKKGRIGDLFAGTGAVSGSVISEREVLTSDVQEYSRVLCSALLNPALEAAGLRTTILTALQGEYLQKLLWCLEPLVRWEQSCLDSGAAEVIAQLLEAPSLAARSGQTPVADYEDAAETATHRLKSNNLWDSPDSTVSRLFGGVYFSYPQAALLDAALKIANELDLIFRDSVIAVALSTASSIVNTVGKHFAQPIRPRAKTGEVKQGFTKAVLRDRAIDPHQAFEIWLDRYASLAKSRKGALVLRNDFETVLQEHGSELSVIYADPPYTRDHYSRFYHVLETMCLRDNPEFSTVTKSGETTVSRGLYRSNRFQSDFCVRSLAPGAFDRLFKLASERELPLVLSYSPHESGDGTHPRVVSQDQIISLAQKYYPRVKASPIDGSTHNIMNSKALRLKDRAHAEILVQCYF